MRGSSGSNTASFKTSHIRSNWYIILLIRRLRWRIDWPKQFSHLSTVETVIDCRWWSYDCVVRMISDRCNIIVRRLVSLVEALTSLISLTMTANLNKLLVTEWRLFKKLIKLSIEKTKFLAMVTEFHCPYKSVMKRNNYYLKVKLFDLDVGIRILLFKRMIVDKFVE